MRTFIAAAVLATSLVTLAPTADAAPLGAAPFVSVQAAEAQIAAEPVHYRRHNWRPYYYYRPYPAYGLYFGPPVRRECWWRHGYRHCVVRRYW